MIPRFIKNEILLSLKKPDLVVGIFGARRTGKTFLMEEIRKELGDKVLMVQGDNLDVGEILSSQRLSQLKRFTEGINCLFIDEAQKIPDIGINLKLMIDNIPGLHILVSGSSSFDLRKKVGEPLTGRSQFFYLYPVAQLELSENFLLTKENLESRLLYGGYPQVITASTVKERIAILTSIRDGYLLKDILELDNQKDSLFVLNLLRLIAFQIGNDISFSELASKLNVNKKTVMRYLELLEKCFVLFSLHGFSRNLRTEYTKSPRYYFWDNGIRNVLISNFNNLNLRDDIGKLWENYCISERLKKTHYLQLSVNHYFWRTYDQKEIDLIEESGGNLIGYELKWTESKAKHQKTFLETYHPSDFKLINRENYLDFIT
ncbi:MAG: ATP-binding protein [Bacteroidetes bacterium]|nr:ATP-binding protein [Bacteroidota bacterium]